MIILIICKSYAECRTGDPADWGRGRKVREVAALLPIGHRLVPERLDGALSSTAGDVRIQEMSPSPIQLQNESILTWLLLHGPSSSGGHFSLAGNWNGWFSLLCQSCRTDHKSTPLFGSAKVKKVGAPAAVWVVSVVRVTAWLKSGPAAH